MLDLTTHVVIPDTQVAPGVPTHHLAWIGQYLVDEFAGRPLKVIHLGDHWDMPSLSSYDRKGGTLMEGRRYSDDIEAGNEAFAKLTVPLDAYNIGRRRKWKPELHFLLGNHEARITRVIEQDAQMEGLVGLHHLETDGWQVHDFLRPVFLDGVGYAHYWYQPLSGRPYAGMVETKLKTIGHTFTQGHVQTLQYGVRYVAGRSQHGLIAGACYLHEEDYKGPQGNAHWRGIIVKHAVHEGSYNPMFVDLDYLKQRYGSKKR